MPRDLRVFVGDPAEEIMLAGPRIAEAVTASGSGLSGAALARGTGARLVLVVAGLVLSQDAQKVPLIPDQGAV